MKFTPVLEFEPGYFRKDHREHPPFDAPNWEELSRQFWYDVLSDWDIVDMHPITPGSWFVNLHDVTDRALEVLIALELEDIDFEEIDHISTFSGGFSLQTENGAEFHPMCCGSLDNLENWREAFSDDMTTSTDIWIGHPYLWAERTDKDIISLSWGLDDPEDPKQQGPIEISRSQLNPLIQKAHADIMAFNDRINAALVKMGNKDAEKIARQFSGLYMWQYDPKTD